MKTAAQHAAQYPGARSTTLVHLIKSEQIHAQLRKEVEARRKVSWLGWMASWWRW